MVIQILVNAISLSLIYVLFALGLTLTMGIFDICNFAYGEFVMVAGFVAYFMVGKWGLPYILAPIAAMVVLGLLGIIFEKGMFYPMRNRGGLEPALATFGASGYTPNCSFTSIRRNAQRCASHNEWSSSYRYHIFFFRQSTGHHRWFADDIFTFLICPANQVRVSD